MVWLLIMIPVSAFITGIGIYAWNRKKPMWFWSGTNVKESEISDIPAYNRACGIMFIAYSALFWISTILGGVHETAGGIFLILGCVLGTPVMVLIYGKIYEKYKNEE